MLDLEARTKAKMRSDDRRLILKVVDGKKPLSTSGLIDPRLFSGEHNLRAVRDPQNSLWTIKYQYGILPNPLQQSFTTFQGLLDHANNYFAKRNLDIVEIID